MACIPLAGDVAELIGSSAEKIDNRSLLLDKFLFHKNWPTVTDSRGRDVKWDDASRWSFVRIADGASDLLNKEAGEKRRKARGNNVEPDNKERYLAEAAMAESLAKVSWDTKELSNLRARHTRRFLSLFRGAYGDRASICIAQLEGRLAINLADSLIQNAGICLDHLFGLPFIPGSAIKGVCRHAALSEVAEAEGTTQEELFALFCAVFGTSDNDFSKGGLQPYRELLHGRPENQKGGIAFLPAYPVNEARIVVDLTNVHYPEYYRTGREEDLFKEQLRPNPFPVVEVGAQFAFCLVDNGISKSIGLIEAATRWLKTAITVNGLGAKTGAGYGWFSLQPAVLNAIEEQDKIEAEAVAKKAKVEADKLAKAADEQTRLDSMSPLDRAVEFLLNLSDEFFAKTAKELSSRDEIEQRAMIQLLRDHKDKRDRWKTWKKKKPEIAALIDVVRQKLNLPPLP